MENSEHIERRLTDLEIKASFQEDLLDELNRIVFRQQQQIELLTRELGQLRETAPEAGSGVSGASREELPPHY